MMWLVFLNRCLNSLQLLYHIADGRNLLHMEQLKRGAVDVLTAGPSPHCVTISHSKLLPITSADRRILSDFVQSVSESASGGGQHSLTLAKMLLEEMALTKRVGRAPDSVGLDLKTFYHSGKITSSLF